MPCRDSGQSRSLLQEAAVVELPAAFVWKENQDTVLAAGGGRAMQDHCSAFNLTSTIANEHMHSDNTIHLQIKALITVSTNLLHPVVQGLHLAVVPRQCQASNSWHERLVGQELEIPLAGVTKQPAKSDNNSHADQV